jgi:hypothetical protein
MEKAARQINKTSKDPLLAPSLRTVQSWRKDKAGEDISLPQKHFLELIIQVLFGEAGRNGPEAEELRDLHRRAAAKQRQPPNGRTTSPDDSPAASAGNPPSLGTGNPWQPIEESNSRPLAELTIHVPDLSNRPTETVALPVSVSLGCIKDEIDGRMVTLTLSGARLTPAYKNCSHEQGSRLGDDPDASHPAVTCQGGVWDLSGPVKTARLATIEFTGMGEPEVDLELSSGKRQIQVLLASGKKATTKLREKMIQVYVQEKLTQGAGSSAVWAKSTLRRRPR